MSLAVSEAVQRDYAIALRALKSAKVPFVVGGAWAVARHVRIGRRTLDVDLMIRPGDIERGVAAVVAGGGHVIDRSDVQVRMALREAEIDLIHHFAHGEYEVDDDWRRHAVPGRLFGEATLFAAPEELVWSKVFVAARHRFDGADIVHLLRDRVRSFDWHRLRAYLAPYPELLFAYLTLFAFTYPNERQLVPRWLWDELEARVASPSEQGAAVCRGTLIDSHSFEFDLVAKGFDDARPDGR